MNSGLSIIYLNQNYTSVLSFLPLKMINGTPVSTLAIGVTSLAVLLVREGLGYTFLEMTLFQVNVLVVTPF